MPAGPGDERGSGGVVTYVGDYVVHTLSNGDTFTPSAAMDVDILVVGPGANGGASLGGGGGAGEVIRNTSFSVSAGVTVTIDATSSIFDSLTAVAGGVGGENGSPRNGANGGSGGGGGSASSGAGVGGTATGAIGNDGGDGTSSGGFGAGGGGGAGGLGEDGTTSKGGDGGDGYDASDFGLGTVAAGGAGAAYASGGGTAGTSADGGGAGNSGSSVGGSATTAGSGGGGGGFTGSAGLGAIGTIALRYQPLAPGPPPPPPVPPAVPTPAWSGPALLWLYDVLQNQVAALRDVDALKIDQRLQDQHTMTFTVRADEPMSVYLIPDRLVRFEDTVFTITEVKQERKKVDTMIHVTAEARWVELARRIRAGTTTILGELIEDGADTILNNTGWALGDTPADSSLYSIDFLDESVVYLLRRWAAVTGTELEFDTVNKIVHFRAQVGENRGVGFRYGVNLLSITRRYEPPVATRLWAYGANDLSIAASNPTGLEYIEDYSWYTAQGITLPQAQARYRRDQVWADGRYLTTVNLYDAAVERLAELAQPVISYEMDVLDLYALADTTTPTEVGDTVIVRDQEFDLDLTTRVVRTVRYPNAPWRDTVELSYLQKTTLTDELVIQGRSSNPSAMQLLVDQNDDPTTVASSLNVLTEIAITVAGETSFAAGATIKGTCTGSGTVTITLAIEGTPETPQYDFDFDASVDTKFEFSWPTFATGIDEGSYVISWRAQVTSGSGTIDIAAEDAKSWILIRGAVGVGVNTSPSASVQETLVGEVYFHDFNAASVTGSDEFVVEFVSAVDITVSAADTITPYADTVTERFIIPFTIGDPTFGTLDGPGVLDTPD